ncbi:MAG TPA: hypothetical protein ENJ19_08360 [Gammaproteobacteria bacterium]|nr:hypothetical protein [Gammaproteobacteria bacterium]
MSVRRALLLSNSGLAVCLADGRRLHHEGFFAADDSGVAALRDHLAGQPSWPCILVADVVEEDFRVEDIPRVGRRDRAALLKRQLGRLYRDSEFRFYRHLGRAPGDGRRDEALFGALTAPALLTPWLAALEETKTPLAAVTSVPLLSAALLRRLGRTSRELMLVSEGARSGLRQSFIKNGRVLFTRLSHVPELSAEDYAAYVHQDIGKTKRFISNLRLIGRDATVPVVIVSGGPSLAALAAKNARDGLDYCALVDGRDLLRLQADVAPASRAADALYLCLALREGRANYYAPPVRRRHLHTQQVRQALHWTTAACLLGGVAVAGVNVIDGGFTARKVEALGQAMAALQTRYDQALAVLPEVGVAADDIHAAVSTARLLQEQSRAPQELLVRLSHNLGRAASLRLERLSWFTSTDPAGTSAAGDEEAMAEDEGGEETPPAAAGAAVYQVLLFEGRVAPFDGSFLKAHQQLEAFLEAVRRWPGIYSAEVESWPLNVDPRARLSGVLGRDDTLPQADFSLRIVVDAV